MASYPLYPRLHEEVKTEFRPNTLQSVMHQHECLTCGFVNHENKPPMVCQALVQTIHDTIEKCHTPCGHWKCHGCCKENRSLINYCDCGLKRGSTIEDAKSKIVGTTLWHEIHDVVKYSWHCGACTYINVTCTEPTSQSKCEMCETNINL